MTWKLGQFYTRDHIHRALRRPATYMSFLPWKKGVGVVAACLRPDLNPDAPRVVLPGRGVEKERTATWLSDHPEHAIPVFLKRAPNKWEYVGQYRCVRWTDDANEIRKRTPLDRRDAIYRVLFLESVE
jgi:hypothetical protein